MNARVSNQEVVLCLNRS